MDFNKREFYESEIAPRLAEIKKLCIFNGMPMFAAFAVENSSETSKTYYEEELVSPGAYGIPLEEDYFKNFVKCGLGFEATVPIKKVEVSLKKTKEEVDNYSLGFSLMDDKEYKNKDFPDEIDGYSIEEYDINEEEDDDV